MNEARIKYLLEQAYHLLKIQQESGIVLNLLDEIIRYDHADCDGHCLMDDIADALLIEEE